MLILLLLVTSYQQSASYAGINDNTTAIYMQQYQTLLPEYIVDMRLPEYLLVQIIINPCDTCIDYPIVFGGPDMTIQLTYSNYIVQCDPVWELLQICGTYLEIHKPLDKTILYSVQVTGVDIIQLQYLSTKGLQSGRYEIWVVIRSRIGWVIQYVKPFFVTIVI